MKKLVIIFVYISFLVSCSKQHNIELNTYEYFKAHLKQNMTYSSMLMTFGRPDEDLGSGIHIYAYNLKDGTTIFIGYTDKVLYANHVDTNTQALLHVII